MECDECKRLNALCEFYANDDDLAWHGCRAEIESCQDKENCSDYQQACDCACQERKMAKKFELKCTCASWGHYCSEEVHDCPTGCLRPIPEKQELSDDEIHEAIVKHTARAVNIILGKEDKK